MVVTSSPSSATESGSVLPLVARPRTGLPGWAIALAFVVAACLLFGVLNARRLERVAPATEPRALDHVSRSAAPPPLYVPPAPVPAPYYTTAPAPPPAPPLYVPAPPTSSARLTTTPVQPQVTLTPQNVTTSAQPVAPPPRVASGAAVVIDYGRQTAPQSSPQKSSEGKESSGDEDNVAGERVSAGVLANRATTVSQGTLIPAVLETALDSSHPGLARAIVSRDIRGFDGARVLIPRGSRLIGEYKSDVDTGQNRMLVNWIRLIRPDGASVAIGSPSGDTLGRAGVRASVNTHFFERFAGAFLQSALDVGVNLASRSSRSPVVVALPGSLSSGVSRAVGSQPDIRPTLKVKAATSVSIFVARDLDFTAVEGP